MDRKDFLKRTGGSFALASLAGASYAPEALAGDEERRRRFFFVAVSKADTVAGVDRIAMDGGGRFDAKEGEVKGSGNFTHFDNAPPGTPKPIIAFGRWKVTDFVSFGHQVGTWGAIEASILELLVELHPVGGNVVKGVTLEAVCNIGPAGLFTGEEEGFVLTIPGAPFGSFKPLVPAGGLTHISKPGF